MNGHIEHTDLLLKGFAKDKWPWWNLLTDWIAKCVNVYVPWTNGVYKVNMVHRELDNGRKK